MRGDKIICPECGVEFEPKNPLQKYCKTSVTKRDESMCQRRASGRRHDRKRGYRAREDYQREWRERKAAEGFCVKCGKYSPAEGNRVCSICIEDVGLIKG